VKQAIKKLKSGKAPGENEICAEMKASGEETARHLCQTLPAEYLGDRATTGSLENRPRYNTAKEGRSQQLRELEGHFTSFSNKLSLLPYSA